GNDVSEGQEEQGTRVGKVGTADEADAGRKVRFSCAQAGVSNGISRATRCVCGFDAQNYIQSKWTAFTFKRNTAKNQCKKKNLLNDLSGNLRSGELTAILGPSGAGKTTLLNILSGFQTRSCQGQLFVNGQATKEKSFRKLSSYIMNGDNLIQHLTVRETIDAAARLKMPENSTYQQRDALVTNLLKSWDLDGCEHRAIRHLSSGQRKRVTVAQELVNTPPVIFLDEPTSGLDSSSSLQCIMLLRELATRGLTIAFSIHQPSSRLFQLFDRLYVLAEGSCIYRGPAKDMVLHLNSNGLQCPPFYNPADFMIEVASGDYGSVKDSLVEYTNRNMDKVPCYAPAMTNGHTEDTQHDEVAVVPLLTKMVFHLRLATHLTVGVIMGLLYYGTGNRADLLFNNATLVFFALMFLTFTGMMPVVLVYIPAKRHTQPRKATLRRRSRIQKKPSYESKPLPSTRRRACSSNHRIFPTGPEYQRCRQPPGDRPGYRPGRALKILPAANQPASLSIAEVVREEVQRAIQPEAPASVAEPKEPTLTYAAVARRPPPPPQAYAAPPRRQSPTPQHDRRHDVQVQYACQEPRAPRKTDVWRTTDRRPLCYHCGEADHVYRRCPYRRLGLRGFHPNDPRPRYGERPREIDEYLRRPQSP
ncbi:hypothetical protein HPB47_016403, partial [Ixodes persulcatus]